MASVRELLGLGPSESSGKPPQKKLKLEQKKLDGMQRELYSLLGENTPSVAIGPHHDARFKDRPNWKQRATPWKWVGFKNSARGEDDKLVLYHWVKGSEVSGPGEGQSAFVKLNTTVDVPKFSAEEYDRCLKNDDWTFDETKYLFDLCREYDLRWVVIHDRYDWQQPSEMSDEDVEMVDAQQHIEDDEAENSKEGAEEAKKDSEEKVSEDKETKEKEAKKEAENDKPQVTDEKKEINDSKNKQTNDQKVTTNTAGNKHKETAKDQQDGKDKHMYQPFYPRILEDLKDRYYSVCRALLEQKGPFQTVDQEMIKQMNYSKEAEIKRRAHLEQLLKRTPAEIAEEEALVLESRKLEAAAERMLAERSEILRLLDAPQATASISQYQTSQGLAQLTSTLLTSDRNKKRKETPGSGSGTSTPVGGAGGPSSAGAGAGGAGGSGSGGSSMNKRNGMALAAQVMQKKLSAKEEQALGISYHDKLSAGVYLRSTKITNLKPSVQSKVAGVMAELGIAPRPLMPTAKVCAKFESLQQSVSVLLDAKRQYDKLDAELTILRGQKK